MIPRPPTSPLFPYTTLFRSTRAGADEEEAPASAQRRDDRLHGRRDLAPRSEEHTSELQSHHDLVCRLLLEKKNKQGYPFAFVPIYEYPCPHGHRHEHLQWLS